MMTMLGLCLASLTSSRCSICILSVGGFHKFSLFLFGINKKNMMCEKGASGVWRLLTIESLQTSVAWVFISIRLSLRKFAIMDHEGILNRPLTKRLSVSSQKIIHFTVMPLQFLALITSLVAQLCYFSRAWDKTVMLQSSASQPSSPTVCRRWSKDDGLKLYSVKQQTHISALQGWTRCWNFTSMRAIMFAGS